jgi:hypothetical protein
MDMQSVARAVALDWCGNRTAIDPRIEETFAEFYVAYVEKADIGLCVWDWDDCADVWHEFVRELAGLAE